jgi:hypothetical protein
MQAWPLGTGAPLAAGQEVFSALDEEQSCGTVVQAARAPDGHGLCIASLQTQAAETARLQGGAPGGPNLQVMALPYPLLHDL